MCYLRFSFLAINMYIVILAFRPIHLSHSRRLLVDGMAAETECYSYGYPGNREYQGTSVLYLNLIKLLEIFKILIINT